MEAAPAAKGRLNGNGSGSSSGGSSSSTAPSASAPATAAAEVPATAESNERSSFVRFDFLSNFFREIFRHVIHDEDVMDAVVKLSTWAVWFAVLLSVIGTLGVDTKPLLSLLGITGITLGVALKDQISGGHALAVAASHLFLYFFYIYYTSCYCRVFITLINVFVFCS